MSDPDLINPHLEHHSPEHPSIQNRLAAFAHTISNLLPLQSDPVVSGVQTNSETVPKLEKSEIDYIKNYLVEGNATSSNPIYLRDLCQKGITRARHDIDQENTRQSTAINDEDRTRAKMRIETLEKNITDYFQALENLRRQSPDLF